MKTIASYMRLGATRLAKSRIFRVAYEARALLEAFQYYALPERRLTERLTRGDGRPLMIIPAFLCGDSSTWALRRFLKKLGYSPLAWRQGINWGPHPGVRTRLLHRLRQIEDAYEEPVTLIGWSLGGYYARELACIRPDLVREVITLGSPLHGRPDSTAVWRAFLWLNRKHIPQLERGEVEFPQPQVPCLSIYTKDDGIVPWEYCVPPRGRPGSCVQVEGSHMGLVANSKVMRLLATHLGSPRTTVDPAARHRRRQLARAQIGRHKHGFRLPGWTTGVALEPARLLADPDPGQVVSAAGEQWTNFWTRNMPFNRRSRSTRHEVPQ